MSEHFNLDVEVKEASEALSMIREYLLRDLDSCALQLHSVRMLPGNEAFSLKPVNVLRGVLNSLNAIVYSITNVPRVFSRFKIGELEKWYQSNRVSAEAIFSKDKEFFLKNKIHVPVGFTQNANLLDTAKLLLNELNEINSVGKAKLLKSLVDDLVKSSPTIPTVAEPNEKLNTTLTDVFESPKGYKTGAPFFEVLNDIYELPELVKNLMKPLWEQFNNLLKSTSILKEVEPKLKRMIPDLPKSGRLEPSQIEELIKLLRFLAVYNTYSAQYVLYLHKLEHNTTINMVNWKDRL